MERYIRDKWEKKLFQEEEPVVTANITELQQIGDSNLSLATTTSTTTSITEQQIMHTPSLSSASSGSLSSPSISQQLAGRVSPSSTNPFVMQSTSPYNPFSSSSTSSGKVHIFGI